MPTLKWEVAFDRMMSAYESLEPPTLLDEEKDKIRRLRILLDVDYDSNYTLEELEEMWDNRDEKECDE